MGDIDPSYPFGGFGIQQRPTIRNNHIHDVYSYAHVSHGSGIYPDEGSTGILIERLTLRVPDEDPIVRNLPYRSDAFRRIDWLGKSLHFGTGDFSISLWLCPTMLAIHHSDARRRFLSKSDHPRTWLVMDITPAGRISLEMSDQDRVSCVRRTEAGIPENEWSHLAAVVDRTNGQIRFYLNGHLDSEHDIPPAFRGPLNVPTDLTIGSTWQPFVGLLDQVRIFRRSLDESEIEAFFQSERDRRTDATHQVVP